MTGRDNLEQLASMNDEMRRTVLQKSPGPDGEALAEMLAKHAEAIRAFANAIPPISEEQLSAVVQQYDSAMFTESSDARRVLLVLLSHGGDVLSHRVAAELPGPLNPESVKAYFPGTGAETRVSGMQRASDPRAPERDVTVIWAVADQ